MNIEKVLQKELDYFIQYSNEQLNNKNIVVAVSCGVDSISLLHALENMQERYQYKIVIAHVNHGRRKQSEIEEEYIKQYADDKKIDIEILKLTENDFSGVNFQEEARDKRLAFFSDVLKKYNSQYLFLAHHLNDDAETIIMRLMRNSSYDALYGMKKINYEKGIFKLRPFLDIKKEDLYEYANQNHYSYFEDYTNQEDHYTRNQVRHHLIESTFKSDTINDAILNYKNQMKECFEAIIQERDAFIKEHIHQGKIDLKALMLLDDDKKIDILFEVLKKYNLSSANIFEIEKILCSKGNKKLVYKNILIIKEYDNVTFCDYYEENLQDITLIIPEVGEYKMDEIHQIQLTKTKENLNNSNFNVLNKDIIWYNHSMLPFIIRNKKDGDRIRIKNGYKKVNDVLSDLKMPLSEREKVKVLLDKEENIISILGVRKSYLLNECEEKDLLVQTNYYHNL